MMLLSFVLGLYVLTAGLINLVLTLNCHTTVGLARLPLALKYGIVAGFVRLVMALKYGIVTEPDCEIWH